MAQKQFTDKKRITMAVVAEATGIHRTTLSKIANVRNYKTSTVVLDKLCTYFEVSLPDVAEYVKGGDDEKESKEDSPENTDNK